MKRKDYEKQFIPKRNAIIDYYKTHSKKDTAEQFNCSENWVAIVMRKYGTKKA